MANEDSSPTIPEKLETAFARADDASRGWLGVLRRTLDSFSSARGPQAAAALSYYGLFSLFPLGVLLITALSFFIDADTAQELIDLVLQRILPDAQGIEELVFDTLESVFAARGEVTVISLIALLWAASGVFTNLTFNLDLAWSGNNRPNVFTARLMGLLIVAVVYVGLVVLLLSSAALGVLSMLPAALLRWLGFSGQIAQAWTVRAIPFAISVLVFFGLYKWVPRAKVPWSIALWGALFAAVATQILNLGFTWYLSSGLARYETLYGPLTTIIVLLFWFYLTVLIILIGAHFGSAMAQRRNARRAGSLTLDT
jgi:membrane protein